MPLEKYSIARGVNTFGNLENQDIPLFNRRMSESISNQNLGEILKNSSKHRQSLNSVKLLECWTQAKNLWIKVQYTNICLGGKSKNAGKCDLKTFECSRNSEQIPVFGNMSSNITVQREGTAFLHCPVKNPGDRPVSYPLVSKYKQEYKLYL